MRWRMDAAVRQESHAESLALKPDIAVSVYPVWFENAARLARDQEG